jgi:hypothetical protein
MIPSGAFGAGYQDKERKKSPKVNVLLCAWSLGHERKKVAIHAVSHFFFFGHESRSIGIGGGLAFGRNITWSQLRCLVAHKIGAALKILLEI